MALAGSAAVRSTSKRAISEDGPYMEKRQESQEGRLQSLGFARDKKADPTTTDFAEWRDWRQVRVVISRRGHDLSCPYWCLNIALKTKRP